MPTNAISVDQLKFKANNAWNGLDEVRIVNDGSALYCKENVNTGLLMEDNQLQVVAVSWTNGVPSIGAKKGYISSDGDYHIYNSSTGTDTTSLNSLRESVSRTELSSSLKAIQHFGSYSSASENYSALLYKYKDAPKGTVFYVSEDSVGYVYRPNIDSYTNENSY